MTTPASSPKKPSQQLPGNTPGPSQTAPQAMTTPQKLTKLKLSHSILKGPDDWQTWKIHLEDWMFINEVEGYVDPLNTLSVIPVASSTASPPVTMAQVTAWKKVDRQVLATIRKWVDPTVMKNILSAVTSLEAWQRLTSIYETTDVITLIHNRRKFYTHRMLDGETVEEHLHTMQGIFDKLCSIDVKYATDFDWAITLVSSLPSSWDVFVQTLGGELEKLKDDTKHTEVAFAVRSKILAEGQRRENNAQEEQAMVARYERVKGKQTDTSEANAATADKKGACNYCHRIGHWEAECRTKVKDKERKEKKKAKKEEAAKANVAQDDEAKKAETSTEDVYAAYAHMAVGGENKEKGKEPD